MTNQLNCQPIQSVPALAQREIHLWRVMHTDLDTSRLNQHLNGEELERASRFVREKDRVHNIHSRGLLRELLSGYIGVKPAEIEFSYPCQCGKPKCPLSRRKPTLVHSSAISFNVSHSGDMIIYAFTLDANIGVDVEQHRDVLDIDGVTEHFFTPSEYQSLQSLEPGARRKAFYRCWTRKEAYIKARGMGLSHGLDTFEMSVLPGEPAALLADTTYPSAASNWSIIDFIPASSYSGALAIDENGMSVIPYYYQRA